MPSPTEMTVPTSSTSTPCVTPWSWALMSWVISWALMSAISFFLRSRRRGEGVQRGASFLEPARERRVEASAAHRDDETAEERGVDGRDDAHGRARAAFDHAAQRLEDRLVERARARHARLEGAALAVEPLAHGREERGKAVDAAVLEEDVEEPSAKRADADLPGHGVEERLAARLLDAGIREDLGEGRVRRDRRGDRVERRKLRVDGLGGRGDREERVDVGAGEAFGHRQPLVRAESSATPSATRRFSSSGVTFFARSSFATSTARSPA